MKKFFAIAIVAIMMISLVSCGTKTYETDGFSIELSPTFIDGGSIAEDVLESTGSKYDGNYAVYVSLIEGIGIIAATESSDEDVTAFEYTSNMAEVLGVSSNEIFYINDAPAFECDSYFGSSSSIMTIIACYEDDGEFWMVASFCSSDKYEEKKADMIGYLETIEVE